MSGGVKRRTNWICTTAAVHWPPIFVREPGVSCGNRAPDAPGEDLSAQPRRLFEMFRGPHWTLLSFGGAQDDVLVRFRVQWAPFIRVVRVLDRPEAAGADDFVDAH